MCTTIMTYYHAKKINGLHECLHFIMAHTLLWYNQYLVSSPDRALNAIYGLQISLKHIKCRLDYIKCIYVLFSWSSPVHKLVTALTIIGENFGVFMVFYTQLQIFSCELWPYRLTM